MKELKEIIQYAKEDPKDFFLSLLTVSLVFFMFYLSLWVAAILEGRV